MRKLRLLLTKDCDRNCKGCCNKDWDLDNLPQVKDYSIYDEIYITGGEPMLYPKAILFKFLEIREVSTAKIYLYTANITNLFQTLYILTYLDGITLTLHEQKDVKDFYALELILRLIEMKNKSLRLNVFKGIEVEEISSRWKVKKDIEWIKNCPLPKDEELMRI